MLNTYAKKYPLLICITYMSWKVSHLKYKMFVTHWQREIWKKKCNKKAHLEFQWGERKILPLISGSPMVWVSFLECEILSQKIPRSFLFVYWIPVFWMEHN